MPKADKESALLRQWELLRMLTVAHTSAANTGRWDRASELTTRLNAQGFGVSLRTVQRDLLALSTLFGIEVNDKNPRDYGWRWKKGANLNIGGLSSSEALLLAMSEQQLIHTLPKNIRETLAPLFQQAKKQLHSNSGGSHKYWLEKVRVISPNLPLIPPRINDAIQETICQALLNNQQLNVHYCASDNREGKAMQLHPLGLIMRGAVMYLVASAWKYPNANLYALHRFRAAEIDNTPCQKPEGFDLDEAIAKGLGEFSAKLESIHLKLRCSVHLATYLAETPLSQDQVIHTSDSEIFITATVNDTWQLHLWLTSQGSSLEVLEPEPLRQRMHNDLRRALKNYEKTEFDTKSNQ